MNDFVHKDTFDARIDEIRQVINAGVARQEKAVAEHKAIATEINGKFETLSAEINGKFETLSAKIDGMQRSQDIFISKASFLITVFAVIIGIIQIAAILTPIFFK